MSTDQLSLEVIAERPVVRNDQISDIDIAIDLLTTKTFGSQSINYAINLCVVIEAFKKANISYWVDHEQIKFGEA